MSRRFLPSPWARAAIADEQAEADLENLARRLGLTVSVGGKEPWLVRVTGHGQMVELKGSGDVSAVIDAALDDFQELVA